MKSFAKELLFFSLAQLWNRWEVVKLFQIRLVPLGGTLPHLTATSQRKVNQGDGLRCKAKQRLLESCLGENPGIRITKILEGQRKIIRGGVELNRS